MYDAEKTREQLEEELRGLRLHVANLEARPAAGWTRADRLPLACVLMDADARVVDWNAAAEQIFGFSRAEALGRDAYELLVPAERRGPLRDRLLGLLSEGRDAHGLNENQTRDGRRIVCEWFNLPLPGPDGRLDGMVALARDVTRRERERADLARQAMLLSAVHDSVIVTDLDGIVTYWNDGATRLFGWSAAEVLGRPYADRFPEGPRAAVAANIRAMAAGGPSWLGEFEDYRKDGSRVWIDASVARFDGADGKPEGLLGLARDIGARKAAEAEAARHREVLQTIFDHIPVMITFENADGHFVLANRHWERTLGWALDELRATDIIAASLPEEEARRQALDMIRQAPPGWRDYRVKARDGRLIETSWATVPLSDGMRISIGQDVTERKQTEAALKEYADRLRDLSRRLILAQEQERRAVAHELHDQIGQDLTAVKLNVRVALANFGAPEAANWLEQAVRQVDRTIGQVRDLSVDLRPSALDDLGLIEALNTYADGFNRRTGIVVECVTREGGARLDPRVETACYRIAQEALANVARHAAADRVRLELSRSDFELRFVIADDGDGFELADLEGAPTGANLGVLGMKERAALAGGRLVIESTPGRGTQVVAIFPLEDGDGPGGKSISTRPR